MAQSTSNFATGGIRASGLRRAGQLIRPQQRLSRSHQERCEFDRARGYSQRVRFVSGQQPPAVCWRDRERYLRWNFPNEQRACSTTLRKDDDTSIDEVIPQDGLPESSAVSVSLEMKRVVDSVESWKPLKSAVQTALLMAKLHQRPSPAPTTTGPLSAADN